MNLIDENGKHNFGTCYQCQSPIAIPSTEIYKCSKCGWVETIEFKQYKIYRDKQDELDRKRRSNTKRQSRKAEAFEGMRSALEEDCEPSLFLETAD